MELKSYDSESPKKKEKKTWRKETRCNGITNCVDVEELDNGGYLVTTSKYGDIDGKYTNESNKMFSKINPLDEEFDEKEDKKEDLSESIGNIVDPMAGLFKK